MKLPHQQTESIPDTTLEVALDLIGESNSLAWLTVNGESMAPLIQHRDQVLVVFEPESVRRGEIVIFQRGKELVTHRLLAITHQPEGDVILTKGDNRTVSDPVINKSRLMGKVIAVRRNDRQIWLNTKSWQRINGLVAKAMLIQTKLNDLGRKLVGNRQRPIMRLFAQGIQSGVRACMGFIQFLMSRYQG